MYRDLYHSWDNFWPKSCIFSKFKPKYFPNQNSVCEGRSGIQSRVRKRKYVKCVEAKIIKMEGFWRQQIQQMGKSESISCLIAGFDAEFIDANCPAHKVNENGAIPCYPLRVIGETGLGKDSSTKPAQEVEISQRWNEIPAFRAVWFLAPARETTLYLKGPAGCRMSNAQLLSARASGSAFDPLFPDG